MKKWLLVLVGLAVVVAVGTGVSQIRRDTGEALRLQREQALTAELQALQDFKSWHEAQQASPDQSLARVFLSKTLIDALLASLDGVQVPLPGADGAVLTVGHVETNFTPGFPSLAVAAAIEKSGVRADVSTSARIEPLLNSGELKLRVHVDSLVPKLSWRFIDFDARGLVGDMAQATLVTEINEQEALGSIKIPISQSSAINTPATQMPFSTTGVTGVATLPAYSASGSVTLTRILAMPEGLYVYANVKQEAGV